MMSDDEKRNTDNNQDGSSSEQPKLADVIEFDPNHGEKKPASENAGKAVSLDEALSSIRESFAQIRAQIEPIRKTIVEGNEALKAGAKTAHEVAETERKDRLEKHPVEKAVLDGVKDVVDAMKEAARESKDRGGDIINQGNDAVQKSAEVINLALERLKRQGIEKKIDLKQAFSDQFATFADKNLKDGDYTVDENGKKVVTLNAKFLQEHGSEVIPAVLGGVANSFVKNLFGDVLGIQQNIDNANKAERGETVETDQNAGEADKPAEAEDGDNPNESPYRVQFDFAKMIGEMLRGATVSTNAVNPSKEDEVTARETAVKGVQLIEDGLNGKELNPGDYIVNTKNTVEPEVPDSLAPTEITPLDEKHERILELAREYDDALRGTDKDDE